MQRDCTVVQGAVHSGGCERCGGTLQGGAGVDRARSWRWWPVVILECIVAYEWRSNDRADESDPILQMEKFMLGRKVCSEAWMSRVGDSFRKRLGCGSMTAPCRNKSRQQQTIPPRASGYTVGEQIDPVLRCACGPESIVLYSVLAACAASVALRTDARDLRAPPGRMPAPTTEPANTVPAMARAAAGAPASDSANRCFAEESFLCLCGLCAWELRRSIRTTTGRSTFRWIAGCIQR